MATTFYARVLGSLLSLPLGHAAYSASAWSGVRPRSSSTANGRIEIGYFSFTV
jgi:hypothetical protein